MRLFIGIFPDDETLRKIRDVIRKLDKIKRNFRFLPFDQMHVTIKFLGNNVSSETMTDVTNLLSNIANQIEPVEIEITEILYGFRGQTSPNVIFMNIGENKKLDDLSTIINQEVRVLGFDDVAPRKDRKKFTHHMSIARTKRSVSNSLVRQTRAALESIPPIKLNFHGTSLHLVESVLTPTGPEYKKLAKFDLAKVKKDLEV